MIVDAAGLARRLRTHTTIRSTSESRSGLERGLVSGVAVVGTSRLEAQAQIIVIEAWAPNRLHEVAVDLRRYVASSDLAPSGPRDVSRRASLAAPRLRVDPVRATAP